MNEFQVILNSNITIFFYSIVLFNRIMSHIHKHYRVQGNVLLKSKISDEIKLLNNM